MNKKTRALTYDEFNLIITTMKEGFKFNERDFQPNNRIATILTIEANLGIRISDVLKLKMTSFIKDGNRYAIDIIEKKTGKRRYFTVPLEIYNYIKIYCLENGIKDTATIFDMSERAVQKHLKFTCDYLGLENISTHSFRKFFATSLYVENNYDIILVQQLLQHSSPAITQKYIGISTKKIESALAKHICLP